LLSSHPTPVIPVSRHAKIGMTHQGSGSSTPPAFARTAASHPAAESAPRDGAALAEHSFRTPAIVGRIEAALADAHAAGGIVPPYSCAAGCIVAACPPIPVERSAAPASIPGLTDHKAHQQGPPERTVTADGRWRCALIRAMNAFAACLVWPGCDVSVVSYGDPRSGVAGVVRHFALIPAGLE